jgi:sugar-specific transcriptional regulator TrmB
MQYTDPAIVKALIQLGIHETDAQLYLVGLQLGASTVIQLATASGINRITAHDSVQRLLHRGLFLETYSGQRRLVYPKHVDALYSLIDQKKAELTQLTHHVDHAISLV